MNVIVASKLFRKTASFFIWLQIRMGGFVGIFISDFVKPPPKKSAFPHNSLAL